MDRMDRMDRMDEDARSAGRSDGGVVRAGPVAAGAGVGMPAAVIAVNVGRTVHAEWAGRRKRTAIDKRPVAGRVAVGRLGLDGDEQADKDNHGGPDQAVYVYAREDLDWWAERLGRQLRDGSFGENLTVRGVDVSGALIGERWRVGSVLLELTAARIPCVVFRNWVGEEHWVQRFMDEGRPGAYARVLEDGTVAAGDQVTVVGRPAASVTIAEAVRAYRGEPELLERILAVPGVSDKWRVLGERVLGSGSSGPA
jgi:MOSC domain-containing protein YiiM